MITEDTKKAESVLSLSVETEAEEYPDSALARSKSPTEFFYSSMSEDEGEHCVCRLCLEKPGSCAPNENPEEENVFSLHVEDMEGKLCVISSFEDDNTSISSFEGDDNTPSFISNFNVPPQSILQVPAKDLAPGLEGGQTPATPFIRSCVNLAIPCTPGIEISYISEVHISDFEDQTVREKKSLQKTRGNFHFLKFLKKSPHGRKRIKKNKFGQVGQSAKFSQPQVKK